MVKFLIKYSQWIIAALGFLVFGVTQTDWLQSSDLWQKAKGVLIDRRYTMRPGKPADPNIKMVGVVDSSLNLDTLSPEEIEASPTLQMMRKPTPWDRRVWAAVLEKLIDAGAKVVVFDFVFPGATDHDEEFAKTLQKYKDQVIISSRFIKQDEFAQYEPPNGNLLLPEVETTIGYATVWADPDGAIRRGKYRTSVENEYAYQTGKFPPDFFPNNLTSIDALAVERFTGKISPLPKALASYIDYQGPPGTYDPLPVEQMFVESLWRGKAFESGLVFSNKIVIIGPMAEVMHDNQPTPFGSIPPMPGAEIHAQIIASLLHESWLTPTSYLFDVALALFLMWLALEICLRIGNALLKAVLLVGFLLAYFIACQVAFTHYKLVLPMVQPLICLMVTGTFGIVFQYALEQFERLRYRNVLGRYVSENVAKLVLEDTRSFEETLKGRKQPVAILFSDIRGFTSMTESTDANKLVAQLNEYFSEMVGIVLKESGTLQKFIGDAIMAAWGDTFSESAQTDARRAVSAALQMRAALVKLNDGWEGNADRKKLAIGIGVNHGDVIVGNIGMAARMEFTVLGDGVNLAARLESATKQFHADILIGETVEAMTREHFVYRSVDLITVKGKTKPVEVFELLSDRSVPPPEWLAKYHDAVHLYRHRQFEAAAAGFKAVALEKDGEDFLCGMYVKRCAEFLQSPPPEDWDGSYTLTEK